MATVVPEIHVGPWTEHDLLALPEDGQRHELLEGALIVSPPAAGPHQRVAAYLEALMIDAVPSDVYVVQNLGVRLPRAGRRPTVLVPDLMVADREAVDSDRSGILNPDHVSLVVEIVSPSSVTMDKFTKPQVYAQLRIPSFWRIELEKDGPRIEVFRLQGGTYVSEGRTCVGEQMVVEKPFPLTFDPAQLAPSRSR